VLDRNPGKIKLVFKNFPLANHRFARMAAAAALVADRQGKFWEFHDELFKNHSTLNSTKIFQIAGELGLDMVRFNKDVKDTAIQRLVIRDMRDGTQAGVRGTPTVFINGKLVINRSLQGIQQKIEHELKKVN